MNIVALITGTIIIIVFSWFFSIRDKRYHGIARFFSFESIFILILLNYKVWFKDPFSLHQIVSWMLLLTSIYPGITGYFLLSNFGKSENNFENTTVLVRSGVYKYIRHPLYCSLLILGTGIMFKDLNAITLILGTVNALAIYYTGRIEESEMITRFGNDYREYMKETKMFIPFIL